MVRKLILVLVLLLALVGGAAAQDLTDTDGDSVPDAYDSCAQEAGVPENSGCPAGVTPDFDGDGVPDMEDFCYAEPGEAQFLGCTAETFPDFDADTVADPLDACPDQSGLTANSGCPEGVTPDLDADGIPDAQDQCPSEYGVAEASGCQPDADGDTIPDIADACPNEAGVTGNYGCPEGGALPDSDGDTIPDSFDGCPDAAGDALLNGCPDGDGDNVPDAFDQCPAESGDPALVGCPVVDSVTLPTNRAPLTPANAAQIAQLGQLRLGTPAIALGGNGMLAARAQERVLLYDISGGTVSASAQAQVGTVGTPVSLSADGQYLATTEFPPDFASPPFVQLRSGTTAEPLSTITATQTGDVPIGASNILFSPAAPLLAVVEDIGAGVGNGQPSNVTLHNVADGSRGATLAHPDGVINMAFSPDGTRLATDTAEGENMAVYLWDVASGQLQTSILATSGLVHFMGTPMAFSPDGTRLAIGKPDGTVALQDLGAGSQSFSQQVFPAGSDEVVSAVAYSPDGSLIAVAGGVPYSGGLTGEEVYSIVLLDAATGAEVARQTLTESLPTELLFSPDGTLLISSEATTVSFWGVAQ